MSFLIWRRKPFLHFSGLSLLSLHTYRAHGGSQNLSALPKVYNFLISIQTSHTDYSILRRQNPASVELILNPNTFSIINFRISVNKERFWQAWRLGLVQGKTKVLSLLSPRPNGEGHGPIAPFLFNLESAVLSGGILPVLRGPLQALQCLLCEPHQSPQGPGER